ncbi:hypothetical protein [Haloarchaeobius sp. HME9146]|uniref:hypothetical protein n=1 Tax=Haloarchaeobius sp. HME9146 TaxID=2978732 RepID=UPI0021BE5963|nr:hypothetical protein [Haloarchaeobius sp. HME9146]MCT9097372.1 hypothetical protein [Haloarchaeobius sp. HME9146]
MTLSRRQLLQTVAVPLAVGLAGCSFSGTLNGTPAGTLFVEVNNQTDQSEAVTVQLRESGQVLDEVSETVPASTSDTVRFDNTGGPYDVRVVGDEWSTRYTWNLTGCNEKRFRTVLSTQESGVPKVENSSGCVE